MLEKIAYGAGFALIFVVLATGLSFLLAFPVMWLWNWVAVDLFHAPVIDFWHAWGLMTLCSFLFKSQSNSSKGDK